MVRIPQLGEPPYNTPDNLKAKFPNQPQHFKGFVFDGEYLLTIPTKYKDISGYSMLNGQVIKIKLFDVASSTKYQIYVVLPSQEGKGITSITTGKFFPYCWMGASPNWLTPLPQPAKTCNCLTQTLMISGCRCGGN